MVARYADRTANTSCGTGTSGVSADIAKGRRERFVPVLAEAVEEVEHIRDTVGIDQYVVLQAAEQPSAQHSLTRVRGQADKPAGNLAHRPRGRYPSRHRCPRPSSPTSPRLWRSRSQVRGPAVRSSPSGSRERAQHRPTWKSRGSMSCPCLFTVSATGLPWDTSPQNPPQSRIRRRPESNRCKRLCRPLRSHSATAPWRVKRSQRQGRHDRARGYTRRFLRM